MAVANRSIEAERGIISSLLKGRTDKRYILQVNESEFTDPACRAIFKAIRSLYDNRGSIDIVTVGVELERLYPSKYGAALASILSEYSFANDLTIGDHIAILHEASRRRCFESVLRSSYDAMRQPDSDLDAIMDSLRGALRGLEAQQILPYKNIDDVLVSAYSELEERSKGTRKMMPSGLGDFDAKTAGFHKGELTIIGARPAVGKSAFAVNIALATAKAGNKVLVCSREMTDVQYGIRILSRGTSINNASLRNGSLKDDDWTQLADSMVMYSDCDIKFTFTAKTIEDLRREAMAIKDEDGLDMLVVDYVQLMNTRQRFEKDYQRIGYISKMLKDMTVDLNIAIVALAQVGRSSDGSMPTLAELRGSGDLEQDADNVVFMHRPESATDKWVRIADRSLFEGLAMRKMQYIVLNIAKQRQGETGQIACVFRPSTMDYIGIRRDEE